MQFKTLALAFFVAAATASTVSELIATLPSCATSCLEDASTSIGCGTTDYTCQCNNVSDLTSASITCLSSACSTSELLSVQTISTEICTDVLASSASSAVSSVVASATSAAASYASSVASAANGTGTSTASTASSSASTAAGLRTDAGLGLMGIAAIFAMAL